MEPPKPWRVRAMCEEDLDAVHAIETQSHPTAWPREVFLKERELEWARLEVLCDAHGVVLGYVDYWLVHDEVHLLNIAVDPVYRRRGCARYLLAYLEAKAREHGAVYITLEVRSRNPGAIQLYEAHGYEAVGRRRGYYSDTGDDAVIMSRMLRGADGSREVES